MENVNKGHTMDIPTLCCDAHSMVFAITFCDNVFLYNSVIFDSKKNRKHIACAGCVLRVGTTCHVSAGALRNTYYVM